MDGHSFLKSILNKLPDGVLVTDRNGSILYGNDSYAARMGIQIPLSGTRFLLGEVSLPLDRIVSPLEIQRVLERASQDTGSPVEATLRFQDGGISLLTGHPLDFDPRSRTDSGDIGTLKEDAPAPGPYRLWLLRDVTELHRKERALQELREQTEQTIQKRTGEQEQMLIQQSRMAAMGEMIGAIAHQWRQPLSALSLMIQDLEDSFDYGQLDRAYLKNFMDRSTKQIEFMVATVDDFRNFFRPSREKRDFSVREAVDQVLHLLGDQLKNNNIGISVDTSGDSFTAKGLPNEFKQALVNLINNARDAILERRERSGDYSSPGRIDFRIRSHPGEGIRLEVEDNGGGISSSVLDRLFEPYVTTKERKGGTGIGLYITRIIIESNMGGSIRASNTEAGALFSIQIPSAVTEGDAG